VLLSTDIWVGALIRRAQLAGAFAAVVRKGDANAGAVLVKAFNTRTREAQLFAEAVGPGGQTVWMQPASSREEPDLDRYIERQVKVDPDLWVVEIEDQQGRHFLTEDVEAR
jgi:hypothetical protein